MEKRLRVGIIGCGEVTQINHLPSLHQLADLFEVTALSDVSQNVLKGVGQLHGVTHRFTDYRELVAHPEVDVVLVASPNAYHSEQTLAAIAQGKHVLVEKPMSVTLSETDAIIRAQRESSVTVQVGYMRRYATAFREAVARVGTMGGIRLARVHDVIGSNSLIIAPTARVIRGDDIPTRASSEMKRLTQEKVREAIGDVPAALGNAYNLLIGLSSHDVSAMRELLGMPKGVLYAAQRMGGRYISAAFDYGDFVCHFETGVDDIARFDCHLEVYGKSQVLRIEYATPYVRHLATRLDVTTATSGSALHRETIQPAFEDNFTAEWRAFHDNVTTGTTPKTTPLDFRHDLELFTDMVSLMHKEHSSQ